ncbi:hypothetical protein ACO0RG_003856 [Hanseniaspora osmophila]|uniref:Putative cardiolipin-specific deacylase, mitochondrial n=1 Tax=Hanseniaspora osmophila TaxID=56408 RepID=A0A1E5RAL1_9ASCO|nr:putative cardiolipin-specific deacylase, mitochondrial [Hanseniaspora osmophila]
MSASTSSDTKPLQNKDPFKKPPVKENEKDLIETYGFFEAFHTWRNVSSLEKTEEKVLSMLPIFPESADPNIRAEIINTPIDYKVPGTSSGNYIHEFYIENNNSSASEDHEVVMVHGYGAALGMFFNNFESLGKLPGIKLHCLDLLGFGLSSRPAFPKRETPSNKWFSHFWKQNKHQPNFIMDEEYKVYTSLKDVENAENFFLDSLESWRIKKNLDNFTLIGHSLGGYLSCCYALKYPERVNKLVLVSPVGVETSVFDLGELEKQKKKQQSLGHDVQNAHKTIKIYTSSNEPVEKEELGPDVAKEMESTEALEAKKEHSENSENSENSAANNKNNNNNNNSSIKTSSSFLVPNEHGHVEKIPNVSGMLKYLWVKEISPFSVLRAMGPVGAKMASQWAFRRFSGLPDQQSVLLMHEYVYGGFKLPGSGEKCLTRILGPGALAYNPLLKRAPQNLQCDSLWLYGDVDWMSKEAGKVMVNKINETNLLGKKAQYKIIENAGHHLYLDNPDDFNSTLTKFLDFK